MRDPLEEYPRGPWVMTRYSDDDSSWAIAVHEAGHAVIGSLVGMTFKEVSIIPDEGSSGRCREDEFGPTLVGAIIQAMAGRAAESEILGTYQPGCDSQDDQRIKKIIEIGRSLDWIAAANFAGEVRPSYETRLEIRTRGLVRRHRDKIECVANALMVHGSLSSQQLEDLGL